nr:pyocin activator PrtN family protein [Pseudoalteromonas sp. Isolate3]
MLSVYGTPMISGKTLSEALGYSSLDAFRQAIGRGTCPINVFKIDNRRGKFALVRDIAQWMAKQRLKES